MIKKLSYKATFFGTKKVGSVFQLDEKDVAEILRIAE